MKVLAVVGLIALAGCAAPVQQHAAETGPKVKDCPVNSVELEHHSGYIGPFVLDGPLTAEAKEAREARAAAEQSSTIPCPVFADKPRPTTNVIERNIPVSIPSVTPMHMGRASGELYLNTDPMRENAMRALIFLL
jgi:hypothetical protein